jgi:hypothetical protein
MVSTNTTGSIAEMVGEAGPTLLPLVPWQPAQVSTSILR